MLTACREAVIIDTRRKHINGEAIINLEAVKKYNSQMGGVDHIHQQLHPFDILRKLYK